MAILLYRDQTTGEFIPVEGGGPPIGVITPYAGSVAPPGWQICDGSAHGSAALLAVIGSPVTPNLQDRFVVAVGPSYAAGAVGGAPTVALTAAQSGVPSHTHQVNYHDESVGHQHDFGVPEAGSHIHSTYQTNFVHWSDMSNTDAGDYIGMSDANKYTKTSPGNHQHIAGTGLVNANHSHTLGMSANGAANASAAHENRPPFYAMVYIIRKA